jgi:hypothetical protein
VTTETCFRTVSVNRVDGAAAGPGLATPSGPGLAIPSERAAPTRFRVTEFFFFHIYKKGKIGRAASDLEEHRLDHSPVLPHRLPSL